MNVIFVVDNCNIIFNSFFSSVTIFASLFVCLCLKKSACCPEYFLFLKMFFFKLGYFYVFKKYSFTKLLSINKTIYKSIEFTESYFIFSGTFSSSSELNNISDHKVTHSRFLNMYFYTLASTLFKL